MRRVRVPAGALGGKKTRVEEENRVQKIECRAFKCTAPSGETTAGTPPPSNNAQSHASDVIDNIADADTRPSRIHGIGLFASHAIPAGTILCVLDGQCVPWRTYIDGRSAFGDESHIEWNALSQDLLLLRAFHTKYSFINHSRSPNCTAVQENRHVKVSALHDIAKGEELTIDYRDEPLPDEYLHGHGATYL